MKCLGVTKTPNNILHRGVKEWPKCQVPCSLDDAVDYGSPQQKNRFGGSDKTRSSSSGLFTPRSIIMRCS